MHRFNGSVPKKSGTGTQLVSAAGVLVRALSFDVSFEMEKHIWRVGGCRKG